VTHESATTGMKIAQKETVIFKKKLFEFTLLTEKRRAVVASLTFSPRCSINTGNVSFVRKTVFRIWPVACCYHVGI
jgi:hypothetical protein